MGIVVDDYMQTSVADVYAAGDVAQGKDLSTGEYYVQAIQPTAVEHAKLAAQSMTIGHTSETSGKLNMNVLDTVGLMTQHVGCMRGLIQTGAHLGEWKDKLLEQPNRLPEAYLASAQAQNQSLARQ